MRDFFSILFLSIFSALAARAECPVLEPNLNADEISALNTKLHSILTDVAQYGTAPAHILAARPKFVSLYCTSHGCDSRWGDEIRHTCEIDPPNYDGQCDGLDGKPAVRPCCECIETQPLLEYNWDVSLPPEAINTSCHWVQAPLPEKKANGFVEEELDRGFDYFRGIFHGCSMDPAGDPAGSNDLSVTATSFSVVPIGLSVWNQGPEFQMDGAFVQESFHF